MASVAYYRDVVPLATALTRISTFYDQSRGKARKLSMEKTPGQK
jgi:hypothetical protein